MGPKKGKESAAAGAPPPPAPSKNDTLLLNVEELIGVSFGNHTDNTVNFKMLQTVLHILARQMRLLEQQVEIKFPEGAEQEIKREAPAVSEAPLETKDKGAKKDDKSKEKEKGVKVEPEKVELAKEVKDPKQKGKDKKDKSGIGVTDAKGVLVVEKVSAASGPDGSLVRETRSRIGSIEVVTRSQFDMLADEVRALSQKTGPVPRPTMPNNDKLKDMLTQGTASLSETMEAMMVNARIDAAEKALGKMAGLLTTLAIKGAVPKDMAQEIEGMLSEVRDLGLPVDAEPDTMAPVKDSTRLMSPVPSVEMKPLPPPMVTHHDLDDAIARLEAEFSKSIVQITGKAAASADQAKNLVKSVMEQLDKALNVNIRVDTLYGLTSDYAEQIKGFDSGLTTQLLSFQEQMQLMKSELKESLGQLDMSNNAESAALTELKEGYENIVIELDQTFHEHSMLDFAQKQIAEELKRLIEWVEMLREQKADRDEVNDGLRDKANISKLKGLVTEEVFERCRLELDKRLELCYMKFQKQDAVWLEALKELSRVASSKAEFMQLVTLRDQATDNIKQMLETLKRLEIILGEPTAAMLTRKILRGSQCGACMVPALMHINDANYGKPPPMPRLILRSMPKEEEPCLRDIHVLAPVDLREHICKRWVGGSHTMLTEHVTHEEVGPDNDWKVPTKRYAGYGNDGRLYHMEEELIPCMECNRVPSLTDERDHEVLALVTPLKEVGGGDQHQIQRDGEKKEEDEGKKIEQAPNEGD